MPVPSTGYLNIVASSVGAPVTVSLPPIVIAPNGDNRAHVMITQISNNTGHSKWSGEVYISQYVQDGVNHWGNFAELQGHNITEITLSASALNATVTGTLLLEYF
jgi:hypothetical protein